MEVRRKSPSSKFPTIKRSGMIARRTGSSKMLLAWSGHNQKNFSLNHKVLQELNEGGVLVPNCSFVGNVPGYLSKPYLW